MKRYYVYETPSTPRWIAVAVPPERLPDLRLAGDFPGLHEALSFKIQRARWHPNPEPGVRRNLREGRGISPGLRLWRRVPGDAGWLHT